jgi:hypothetical protein
MARSASPVGRVTRGEVPVLIRDRLEHTAHATWLPPLSSTELATGVKPLVRKGIDQFEIRQVIVLLVLVPMMDPEPGWNGPVGRLPDDIVSHAESTVSVDPVVAFVGGVPFAASVLALWSAISHGGFTVSSAFSGVKV